MEIASQQKLMVSFFLSVMWSRSENWSERITFNEHLVFKIVHSLKQSYLDDLIWLSLPDEAEFKSFLLFQ